jgi:hypothetical protein
MRSIRYSPSRSKSGAEFWQVAAYTMAPAVMTASASTSQAMTVSQVGGTPFAYPEKYARTIPGGLRSEHTAERAARAQASLRQQAASVASLVYGRVRHGPLPR